jgi:anti-anti-sigma factor
LTALHRIPTVRFTGQLSLDQAALSPDHVVLRVAGEVDMATSGDLDAALTTLLQRQRLGRLVVDLEGVRFLDSSGILVLINGHRRARDRDCELVLTNIQPNVRRILEITGVAPVLGLDNAAAAS